MSTIRTLLGITALTLLAACSDTLTAPRAASNGGAAPLALDASAARPAHALTSIDPAPRAKWTVMVYLAGDNNLAPAAVADLDEMEAGVALLAQKAGVNAGDVQVVVQGEYSRGYLEQAGCWDPACIHLPSWDTFRYAVAGRAPAAPGQPRMHGPQGDVLDLGSNRDLTRASELHEFVTWAKSVRPADHYMLVLWNHGGGYTGLIADESSAGNRLMTLDGLRDGLTDVGPIDVLDFDMCLMAGYETLAKVAGLASTVVFSESTVPGAGNDYTSLVAGIGDAVASGNASAADVAAVTADRFHASYTSGRETTTISAYDMSGFDAFESSLGALADALTARLVDSTRAPGVGQAIHDAVASAQRFDYAPLHDVVDVLDSLAPRVDALQDTALSQLIANARAQATAPGFRLRTLARDGADARALRVDGAQGLAILWPSGDAADAVRDDGPSSLAAYEGLFPDKPWSRFLATYLSASAATAAYDQGDQALQAFLIWDPDATARGADVDLWVLEPDGNLYIPYLGRVTPNGELTADSQDTGLSLEGYATYRYVTRGTYYLFANLARDSADARPGYNLAYRHGSAEDFGLLYDEPLTLSFEKSFLADSGATMQKVIDGAYTDMRLVAKWTPGGESSLRLDGAPAVNRLPRASVAQLDAARRLTAAARLNRARMAPRGVPDAMHQRLRALGLTKR